MKTTRPPNRPKSTCCVVQELNAGGERRAWDAAGKSGSFPVVAIGASAGGLEAMSQLRLERTHAEAVFNAVRRPLLLLDGDMVVQKVNDAFLRAFKTTSQETLQRRIYDLCNGEWSSPRLHKLLDQLPQGQSRVAQFAWESHVAGVGRKKLSFTVTRLAGEESQSQRVRLAVEELPHKQPKT